MAKRKAGAAPQAQTFEEALTRLEGIVRELEEADLPLERSLTVFEEGVRLSRLLHERLNEAERKVEILLKNEAGEKTPAPFATDDDPAAHGVTGGVAGAADDHDEDPEDDDEDEGGKPGGGGQRALPF